MSPLVKRKKEEDSAIFKISKGRSIKEGTAMLKSAVSPIGQISLWEKLTRKRSAGNPHAAFDVAGVGNVLMSQWRASSRPYQY